MNWIKPENQGEDLYSTLLSNRNIKDIEQFLNPTEDDLHDPFLMYGLKDAASIIIKAIEDNKKIYIHGDFDVDGITATTIMWRYLYKDLGANALPYIPSRFDEGYGLSDESIQAIIDDGADLIITVDCGVKDLEVVSKYKDKVDFIITDHHTISTYDKNNKPPNTKKVGKHSISKDALAVVHPQLNDTYPFHEICGAMVSWKLCCGINKLKKTETDMHKFLDLVALGTVCDVMPLIDENRAAVALGLELLRKTENKGLQALLNISSVQPGDVKSYHFGYVLGPRLNAAGRLAHALDAVRLLSTESSNAAESFSRKLNQLNLKRQELTKKYIDLAMHQIEEMGNQPVYFVHGEEWPEGIVGLIAGRLSQKLYKPVLAGSILKDNTIKGSARSIEEVHIANIFKALDDHLLRHGGHAQAAGFTLPHPNLEEFKVKLSSHVAEIIGDRNLEPSINIDAFASIDQITYELIDKVNQLEPFGNKNEEPVIGINELNIKNFTLLGKDKNHIKLDLQDKNLNSIEAIGFNMGDGYLEIVKNNENISIAGKLGVNEWNGHKKIQIKLVDIIPS
jgi:single-stranded-DNA-specific exonuclease